MRSTVLFLLNLSLSLVVCSSVVAQDPFYINFDIEDGLPSSEVYDVHAAKDGRLFITTDRGVCIYDGYEFQTYSTRDGLASNTNFQIVEDYQGRLWLNGMERSLSIFENDEFRFFEYNHLLDSLRHETWLDDLIFDPDGTIYFGTKFNQEYGFASLIHEKGHYQLETKDDFLQQFEKTESSALVRFFKDGEVAFYNYYHVLGKRDYFPYRLEKLKDSWFGGRYGVLWEFSEDGTLLHEIRHDVTIDALFVDRQNNLWVCTLAGLYCYEQGNLELPPRLYFKDLSITNMTQDFEGNYWLSTLTNGVLLVPTFGIKVLRNIDSKLNSEKILHTESLKANVLFATSEGRIGTFDRDFNFHWIKEEFSQGSQFNDMHLKGDTIYLSAIYSFYEEQGQLKELGVYDSGIYTKVINNKDLDVVKMITDSRFEFGSFRPLSNGDYFAYNRSGFFVISDFGFISSFNFDPPFNKKIVEIKEEEDGTIWLGTTEGLYIIENNDYGNLKMAFPEMNDQLGRVENFLVDRLGNLWIATVGNGLFYNHEDHWYTVDQKDGLKSTLVNSIYLDEQQKLWIGTNDGLFALNYTFHDGAFKVNELRHYTIFDGLSSNYINDITYVNDHYWLATNRGITYFEEANLLRNYPLIPLRFDQFVVNNQTRDHHQALTLNYDENDVYIKFTGISHRKDQEAFYQYRLNTETVRQDWFFTNDRSVRYNDLPPGNYIFELSAQNKAGVWTQPVATLAFEIRPHFSQTLWFQVMSVLLILGLLGFIAYNQWNRLKLREQQKRQLQKAEYRMREAELAALRNQMNPHFVFNSLNAIQHFIFKKDVEAANYFLAKFSRLMRDSLEFSRIEYISLKKEITFLKNYLELEMLRFPDKFKYHIEIDQAIDEEVYLIPSLMIQPVLENAIKHAFRDIDYEGIIEITVEELPKQECLKISIRDNGPGLPANFVKNEKKHHSLGLEIVQNRINLLKEDHNDTIASFEIIDWKEIDATKQGVEVYFIVPIKLQNYDQSHHY